MVGRECGHKFSPPSRRSLQRSQPAVYQLHLVQDLQFSYFFLTAAKTLLPLRIQNITVTMVFKDLEEIIHRQYSKSQREHTKIRTLCCPYCDVQLDYFKSPPPPYDPPSNPPEPPRPQSPSSPQYSPRPASSPSSSSSSDDGIPEPPKLVSSTHVALLGEEDLDDLNLQHLEVRKILKKTHAQLTTDFKLE